MGVNFYIVKRCWFCGNVKTIHIGKSNSGSKFLFEVNNEYKPDVHSLYRYLKWRRIEDEKHCKISRKMFFKMVEDSEGEKTNKLCNLIDRYGFEWASIQFS